MNKFNLIVRGENKYAVLGGYSIAKNLIENNASSKQVFLYVLDGEAAGLDTSHALLTLSFTPIIIICSERLYYVLRKLPTTSNKLIISMNEKVDIIVDKITRYITQFCNVFNYPLFREWCSSCLVLSPRELQFIKCFLEGKDAHEMIILYNLSWQRIYSIKRSIMDKVGAKSESDLFSILRSLIFYISMLNMKSVQNNAF